MKRLPYDGKIPIFFWFWNLINRIVVKFAFKRYQVSGLKNLPESGPFLLVANHSSRWDGPVVQYLLARPANYMVSPNEMSGLQGAAVKSVGAFPASTRFDLIGHSLRQMSKKEPVVVFPEGNVFYDSKIHPFKRGAARIAVKARQAGITAPVIPLCILYERDGRKMSVDLRIGEPIAVTRAARTDSDQIVSMIEHLTDRMYDRVENLFGRPAS